MEFYNKPDDGQQHRRQSKDFKEVVNIQTDMNIDNLKWDKIFHNWDNPKQCSQKKRGCVICDMIDRNESVEHLKPSKK